MTATLADLLETHLTKTSKRLGRPGLVTLETGSIRSSEIRFRDGDGWSTVAMATYAKIHGGEAVSVDLDTSTASQVLAAHGLRDNIRLIEANSIDVLAGFVQEGKVFDFILLDSDNDAQLIMHEWFLASRLIRDGGTIMIDDVEPGSKEVLKGNDLIPYLNMRGTPYEILQRSKVRITTGVAVVEF